MILGQDDSNTLSRLAAGGAGVHLIDDTAEHAAHVYRVIYPRVDCTISILEGKNLSGFTAGKVLVAGIPIYGKFTKIKFSAGSAYAYY